MIFMKKIFAYVGSRQNGNTKKVVEQLLQAIEYELGEPVVVQLHTASELALIPCQGCTQCFATGTCTLDNRDHFDTIKEEMLQADLILLASPVYAHQITGDAKIFIDRISYWFHLFRLAGKKAVSVSTSSTNGNNFVSAYLLKNIEFLGMQLVGNLEVTTTEPKMLEDPKFLSVTLPELSKRIAKELMSNEFKASVRQQNSFRVFQNLYSTSGWSAEKDYWIKSKMLDYSLFQDYVNCELLKKLQ